MLYVAMTFAPRPNDARNVEQSSQKITRPDSFGRDKWFSCHVVARDELAHNTYLTISASQSNRRSFLRPLCLTIPVNRRVTGPILTTVTGLASSPSLSLLSIALSRAFLPLALFLRLAMAFVLPFLRKNKPQYPALILPTHKVSQVFGIPPEN